MVTRIRFPMVRGPVILGLLLLATACNANLAHATCGWQTNIPPNGTRICNLTYLDLNRIAQAEVAGHSAVIRKYVSSPHVAATMIAFGLWLRRHHVQFLRVAPNPDLSVLTQGRIQVSLYLVGKTDRGKIDESDGVTERILPNAITVVGDRGYVDQSW